MDAHTGRLLIATQVAAARIEQAKADYLVDSTEDPRQQAAASLLRDKIGWQIEEMHRLMRELR